MANDATLPPELTEVSPKIPRDADGPVFAEPWQAQAFAMAVALNAQGHFTWSEWATRLGGALKAGEAAHQGEDAYYHAWLNALEQLIAQKGLVGGGELDSRKQAWDRAARATPHGEPIVLGREEQPG